MQSDTRSIDNRSIDSRSIDSISIMSKDVVSVRKLSDVYTINEYYKSIEPIDTTIANETANEHVCLKCKESNSENFIILSCHHIFHFKCLVDIKSLIQSGNSNIQCLACNTQISKSELMYSVQHILKLSQQKLRYYEDSVKVLEEQYCNIRKELKICKEYKIALLDNIELSKAIIKKQFLDLLD